MEQHPVPRNITGFQFHLIGDMTVRQFAYLAGGIILAFIVFKVFPLPGGLKFILMGIFGLTGFAFAFLPIQERPLDVWLMAFVKSINSPTQYIWQKNNQPPDILSHPMANFSKNTPVQVKNHHEALDKLHAYLKTLPAPPQQNVNIQEKKYISNTLALFGPTLPVPGKIYNAGVTPLSVTPPKTVVPSIKPAAPLPPPVVKTQIPAIQSNPPSPSESPNNLDKQLSQMNEEKNRLMQELVQLKKELQKMREPSVITPNDAHEPAEKTVREASIKTVNPGQTVNETGILSIPKTPNVIMGAVKDSNRYILPNIIITLKDQKGVPIRALKTNKLGQFASSTALSNGTYLLEVEDPLKRYTFDIAQITLSGKVFLPIEIIAKGEKEIMREKLTKEIFGSANI